VEDSYCVVTFVVSGLKSHGQNLFGQSVVDGQDVTFDLIMNVGVGMNVDPVVYGGLVVIGSL